MDFKRPLHDDDFRELCDEALVVLFRVFKWSGALKALLKRCNEWTRAIVLSYLSAPWNDEDFAEAMQIGLMAGLQAIARYKIREFRKMDGVKFRTFFGTIVGRRISNFFRGRRRYEGHLDRTVRWHEELVRPGKHGRRLEDFLLCHTEPRDPEQLAELHEFRGRLEEVVSHLESTEAGLWKEVCEGSNVSEAARKLGIPEAEARNIWAQLLVKMHGKLEDVGPSVEE